VRSGLSQEEAITFFSDTWVDATTLLSKLAENWSPTSPE
jgi:hypothetical protein